MQGERLVKPNEYGSNFVILLMGKLRVLKPGVRHGLEGWHPSDPDRNNPDHPERVARDQIIAPDDREPIFGFSACLSKAQWLHVRNRTDFWAVDAVSETLASLASTDRTTLRTALCRRSTATRSGCRGTTFTSALRTAGPKAGRTWSSLRTTTTRLAKSSMARQIWMRALLRATSFFLGANACWMGAGTATENCPSTSLFRTPNQCRTGSSPR